MPALLADVQTIASAQHGLGVISENAIGTANDISHFNSPLYRQLYSVTYVIGGGTQLCRVSVGLVYV
jgi:hypothetical protein